jgi:hypothetical protein
LPNSTVICCPVIIINSHQRDMMNQQPLEVMKSSFVGVPYSLCVAHEITSEGYGFSVSCETGTIIDVFQPSLEE